ncbi:heme exporter protein CcmB [Leucothrix sargassi]|nr:heme exporter protein CcmB [Leucothrix sargassi]
MLKSFFALLKRDLLLAMRRRSDILTVLFFFIIVVSIFPLGVGFEKAMLQQIAPGVVWVAALLASTLALERIFSNDFADGTLEQMLMTPQPLGVLVFAKVLAHWLLTGLPLVLIAPLAGLQYHLDVSTTLVMMSVLLIGTPVLSMVGAIGAALTLGLRGGGVLISLLVLPLYIPVLVYGSGAVAASMQGDIALQPYYLLLSAFLMLALVFAPWATAAALRISVE